MSFNLTSYVFQSYVFHRRRRKSVAFESKREVCLMRSKSYVLCLSILCLSILRLMSFNLISFNLTSSVFHRRRQMRSKSYVLSLSIFCLSILCLSVTSGFDCAQPSCSFNLSIFPSLKVILLHHTSTSFEHYPHVLIVRS